MIIETVLDSFGGKGGSGRGWLEGGVTVTGTDKRDFSGEYPGTFVHVEDSIDYVRAHGHEYDLNSGSPPCEYWTRGLAHLRGTGLNPHPRLIAAYREAAEATGRPYVIENVEDAGHELRDPILLCGRMFDLTAVDDHPDAVGMPLILHRHRLFEFGNMPRPAQPHHPKHTRTSGIALGPAGERILTGQPHVAGVYGGARRDPWEAKYVRRGGYVPKSVPVLQQLLGADHISTERELFEAIPPAYIRWVLEQVRAA